MTPREEIAQLKLCMGQKIGRWTLDSFDLDAERGDADTSGRPTTGPGSAERPGRAYHERGERRDDVDRAGQRVLSRG